MCPVQHYIIHTVQSVYGKIRFPILQWQKCNFKWFEVSSHKNINHCAGMACRITISICLGSNSAIRLSYFRVEFGCNTFPFPFDSLALEELLLLVVFRLKSSEIRVSSLLLSHWIGFFFAGTYLNSHPFVAMYIWFEFGPLLFFVCHCCHTFPNRSFFFFCVVVWVC